MMRLRHWVACVATGAVMALGQAPLFWWPAVPLGFVALLWLLRSADAAPGRGMWAAGVGYFAASLFWIVEPFFIEPEIHGWMAPFALVLMAGGMALFWAVPGWLAGKVASGAPRLVALGAGLLVFEWLRGWVLTGFPWAMLGHALIDTPLVHLAALGGASLLSLVLILPALLVHLSTRALPSAALALAGAAVLTGGWLWGARLPPAPDHGPQIVRLVQPNTPQDEKWRPENALPFFLRHLDLTEAPSDTPPDLILWPETAVPFYLEHPGQGLEMMADAASAHPTAPMIGFGVQRMSADELFFNSFAVLTADEKVTHVFDKHHLVPFGEYIPLSGWLLGTPVGGLAGRALEGYTAGPGPLLLDLGPLGQVLPMICYESIFARHVRAVARPDWIAQVTNDAWFGDLTGPFQHLAQARLRAVEFGLPVLRAANTGVSAAIDARGQIVAQIPLGEMGFIDAPLPRALPPTPYSRLGDMPVVLVLLGLWLAAFVRAYASARKR